MSMHPPERIECLRPALLPYSPTSALPVNRNAPWVCPSGAHNARQLHREHPDAMYAIAELDRVGHEVLSRYGDTPPEAPTGDATPGATTSADLALEHVVGLALLRKTVTAFAGLRTLIDGASLDPAKAVCRTLFEVWMATRCYAYGATPVIFADTASLPSDRAARSRYYYVATQRRALRSRALILSPRSPYRRTDLASLDALEGELTEQLNQLRTDYPAEWDYFGDITPARLIDTARFDDEPAWYTPVFRSAPVHSIRDLAHAYAYAWEYDVIYDLFSGQVHPRGWAADLEIDEDGVNVLHPRNPEAFPLIGFYGASWQSMSLLAAARVHAPGALPAVYAFEREWRPHLRALDPLPSLLRLG